jgi:hypothetical protein
MLAARTLRRIRNSDKPDSSLSRTWPEKGPYTPSPRSTGLLLPSGPSLPRCLTSSRTSTSHTTPHRGSSHSGPAELASWKPAVTPDATLLVMCGHRSDTPAAAAAASAVRWPAEGMLLLLLLLPSDDGCMAPTPADSSAAAAGHPNGTSSCASCCSAAPAPAVSAAVPAAAASAWSAAAPLARPACSAAGAPAPMPPVSFASGPCLLAARTTCDAGTSNKLVLLLLLLLCCCWAVAALALQGLHSAMLGPTLRGPSSHARCSSAGSSLLLVSCRLRAYASRSLWASLLLPCTPSMLLRCLSQPKDCCCCCCCCCCWSPACCLRWCCCCCSSSRSRLACSSSSAAVLLGSACARTRTTHTPLGVAASTTRAGLLATPSAGSLPASTDSLNATSGGDTWWGMR